MAKIKRKGCFEYELEFHQNASALVIPKVAEQVLLFDKPLNETLEQWPDKLDFMSRVKVPRGSRLVIHDGVEDLQLENTQRYYVSTVGGYLYKIMPPLAKTPDKWRRIGVESGWRVCPCNNLNDATAPIDYSYYRKEIEKLVMGVM